MIASAVIINAQPGDLAVGMDVIIWPDQVGIIQRCDTQCKVVRILGASVAQRRAAPGAETAAYIFRRCIFGRLAGKPADLFLFKVHPGRNGRACRSLAIATVAVIRIEWQSRNLVAERSAMASTLDYLSGGVHLPGPVQTRGNGHLRTANDTARKLR